MRLPPRAYRALMKSAFPVLWVWRDDPYAGRLELDGARVTLTARDRALSFPVGLVSELEVRRGASQRVRRLPVLALRMASGDVVRVASLGGAGSLHELAAAIGDRRAQAAASGA